MTTSSSSDQEVHHGLSPFVCACFTLNYIIGTGFLTLPWAFAQAGWLFSTLTLLFACLLANMASDYILAAVARADAVVALGMSSHPAAQNNNNNNNNNIDDDESAWLLDRRPNGRSGKDASDRTNVTASSKQSYQSTATKWRSSSPSSSETVQAVLAVEWDTNALLSRTLFHERMDRQTYYRHVPEHGKLLVGSPKFELTELCKLFLGDIGLLAYGISSSLDLYGFLWAYSSVFATAMAHLVPLRGWYEDDEYSLWLCVFALIVIPMSMLSLEEQATAHVVLSACRILMIILLVGTPLLAAASNCKGGEPHFDAQQEPQGAPLVNLQKLQVMFPAVIFSFLFHQAVPGLADEMTNKPKIGVVFGYTYMLCFVAYSLLGAVRAWYFGTEDLYSSANINWSVYHGGTSVFDDTEGTSVHMAWWARPIQIFVVSFPALDAISAFPIYAYTLGNTLLGLFHANKIQEM